MIIKLSRIIIYSNLYVMYRIIELIVAIEESDITVLFSENTFSFLKHNAATRAYRNVEAKTSWNGKV